MKILLVMLFSVFFLQDLFAQDTLIISRNIHHPPSFAENQITHSMEFHGITTIMGRDTINLEMINDTSYFLLYDTSLINRSNCIPFWISFKNNYYIIFIYKEMFKLNYLSLELYSFKKGLFKRRYGIGVSSSNLGYSQLTNGVEELSLQAPPNRQLIKCLCIP